MHKIFQLANKIFRDAFEKLERSVLWYNDI